MHLTSNSPMIWLRAEASREETRTPLVPEDAKRLIAAGFLVMVEHSPHRTFSDVEYETAGCVLVPADTFFKAPAHAVILGLRSVATPAVPLTHRHLSFAPENDESLLDRFVAGSGILLDFNSLLNDEGKKLISFGYWAGFVGAGLAAMAWARQQMLPFSYLPLSYLQPFESVDALVAKVAGKLKRTQKNLITPPTALVIGASGRAGRGAVDFLKAVEIQTVPWTRKQTKGSGPYPEIVDYNLFINCVQSDRPGSPFLTRAILDDLPRKLSIICDVTCEAGTPKNLLPIYDSQTSFLKPLHRVYQRPMPLDLLAIDRLSLLVPKQSSGDFSTQLFPLLVDLANAGSATWRRAEAIFLGASGQVERKKITG